MKYLYSVSKHLHVTQSQETDRRKGRIYVSWGLSVMEIGKLRESPFIKITLWLQILI